MNKPTFWQNQGHLIDDIFIDEINRVYIEGGNLFLVAGASTGIETEKESIKNEKVRLIIPVEAVGKFNLDFNKAVSMLIQHPQPTHSIIDDSDNLPQDVQSSKILGAAFNVSD